MKLLIRNINFTDVSEIYGGAYSFSKLYYSGGPRTLGTVDVVVCDCAACAASMHCTLSTCLHQMHIQHRMQLLTVTKLATKLLIVT